MSVSTKHLISGFCAALVSPVAALPAGALVLLALAWRSAAPAVVALAWLTPTVALLFRRQTFWRGVTVTRRCRPPRLPSALALSDGDAGWCAQRLRKARAERTVIAADLPALSQLTRDRRLRACVADVERGCVDLIFAIDRIGRWLAGRDPEAPRCPAQDALERSKDELCQRLCRLTGVLESIGPWLLELDAGNRARQTAELEGSLDGLSAFLSVNDDRPSEDRATAPAAGESLERAQRG
jgi:hypothetical protein